MVLWGISSPANSLYDIGSRIYGNQNMAGCKVKREMKIPKSLQIILWIAAGLTAMGTIGSYVFGAYDRLKDIEQNVKDTKHIHKKVHRILENYSKDSLMFTKKLNKLEKTQKIDSTVIYYNYYWVKHWNNQ